jgi:hypothetical protein
MSRASGRSRLEAGLVPFAVFAGARLVPAAGLLFFPSAAQDTRTVQAPRQKIAARPRLGRTIRAMRRPTTPALRSLAGTVAVLITFLVAVMAPVRPSHATEVGGSRRLGLGFAVGEPTSLVGKYFINPANAIDFGLAFARFRRSCERAPLYRCDRAGFISVNADYLWQDNLAREAFRLDWHIGAGGRLSVADEYYGVDDDENVSLFARMPIGLDLTFQRPSFLEVFMELAPALLLIPGLELDLEAFIGVRLYF